MSVWCIDSIICYLAALDLSDEDVDGPPVAPLRSAPSKEILVPEENPRTDLKNTLKGKLYYVPLKGTPPSSLMEHSQTDAKTEVAKNKPDEQCMVRPDEMTDDDFEEICTEAILTHIPEDFCECYESDDSQPFDKDSGLESSSPKPNPELTSNDQINELLDENIGVAKICWRITRHVQTLERPKIEKLPVEKIVSYPSLPRNSIDYDPVLYHCENFEQETDSEIIESDNFEFSQVDVVNFRPLDTLDDLGLQDCNLEVNEESGDEYSDFSDEGLTILDVGCAENDLRDQKYPDEDQYSDGFCAVDVDESVMDEPSQLYTKPYINLKIDWM